MTWLADGQRAFATALLNPDCPVPPGLVDPDGRAATKRFGVYRNNVVAGLIEVLKAGFPAVCRLVGEEFFAGIARSYALQQPPRSPIMLEYGAGFADFVSAFAPAAVVPYLSDVARLEWAWIEAYNAAECLPLEPRVFATIPQDDLASLCVELHPSARLVRSRFPALTIWQMNVEDSVPAPLDIDAGGEDVLIVRPHAEVEVRLLQPDGAAFIEGLMDGLPIDAATRRAMIADAGFDLAASLTGLMQAGSVVACRKALPRRLRRRSRQRR